MLPADENRPWKGDLRLSVPGTQPGGLCCPCLRLARPPRTIRTGQERSTSAPNAAFNPSPLHAQPCGTHGARSGTNTSSPCCHRASPLPPSPAPVGFPWGSPSTTTPLRGSPRRPPRPRAAPLPRAAAPRLRGALSPRPRPRGCDTLSPGRAVSHCPTKLRARAWGSCPRSPGPGAAGPICSARLLPGALAARGDAARGTAGFLGQAAEEVG